MEASGAQTQLAMTEEALHVNWETPSLRADCMQSFPQAPKEEYAVIVVSCEWASGRRERTERSWREGRGIMV